MSFLLSFPGNSDGMVLHRELFQAMRRSIESGEIKAHERLPSTRELADILQLSRHTVVAAYRQLHSEGFLLTRPGSGTFVAARPPARPGQDKNTEDFSVSRPLRQKTGHLLIRPPLVSPRDLPLRPWRRLAGRMAGEIGSAQKCDESSLFGHLPLREAIAAYLQRWRGFSCSPSEIVILPSTYQALQMLCSLVVKAGKAVAIQSPDVSFLGTIASANKIESIPVPLSAIESLGSSRISLAVVSPFSPSSAAGFGEKLKDRILGLAKSNGTYILEDDLDHELSFNGSRREAAMKAQDTEGNVIYLGRFDSTLFPLVQICYLVLPQQLISPFQTLLAALGGMTPRLEDCTLARFMHSGQYEAYLHALRKTSATRRSGLVYEMTSKLSSLMSLEKDCSSTWLCLKSSSSHVQAIEAAARCVHLPSTVISQGGAHTIWLRTNILDTEESARFAQRVRELLEAELLAHDLVVQPASVYS